MLRSIRIPVWFLLLITLLGGIFLIFYGWSIKTTIKGNKKAGWFGEVAVQAADFPNLTDKVFKKLSEKKADFDKHLRGPRPKVDLSQFAPVKARPGIEVAGLVVKRDKEALARNPGYRILVGAFTMNGEIRNGAIVLSPEIEIVHTWMFNEIPVGGKRPRPLNRKYIHGFDILDDGSVIFSYDGGISLQKFDVCGKRLWATVGTYHHAVTLTDDEKYVWALLTRGKVRQSGARSAKVVKLDIAQGKVVREFSMDGIIKANPNIFLLDIRRTDRNDSGGNSKNTSEFWLRDPFHLNDVDPLPVDLAAKFPMFNAGDLVISARSLNLIFVIDANTLKIKWWRAGIARRQHDPDWSPKGVITVYDNRMSGNYSRIISIDPQTYQTEVLLNGRDVDFYSRMRGKHQVRENGNMLVTSSQQGRVFETDPKGNVVLDIHNTKPGDDKYNLLLSQAIYLSEDRPSWIEQATCKE